MTTTLNLCLINVVKRAKNRVYNFQFSRRISHTFNFGTFHRMFEARTKLLRSCFSICAQFATIELQQLSTEFH